MADPFQVVVDPGNEFRKALGRAKEASGDLTIPFILMTKEWFKSNQAIFQVAGSSGKYEDLSEDYKQRKHSQVGFVYPVLMRSGRLKGSLTDASNPEALSQIVNKQVLLLGTTTPYAGYLQSGTSRMPARPPVLVGPEQVAPDGINRRYLAWLHIIEDYVRQTLENSGNG